ncbi:MAG TPA: hypothetical protein VGH28_29610 [Polyangiaceae bacterium]|jgi:hypothetical protein
MASVLVSLAACSCMGFNIIPTTDDSSSTGGTDASTQSSSEAGDATTTAVTGVNCGADPDTGAVLCLGISSCPDVVVDSDLYPGCGFRVHDGTGVLDLECACYGQICPIGVASTCDQATALMQDQSQYTVCMQVDEGRCTNN